MVVVMTQRAFPHSGEAPHGAGKAPRQRSFSSAGANGATPADGASALLPPGRGGGHLATGTTRLDSGGGGGGGASNSGVKSREVSSLDEKQLRRIQRQRKQARVSQRRHRDRESSVQYNLMLDINQLKQEISFLESKRRVLIARRGLCGTAASSITTTNSSFTSNIHQKVGQKTRQMTPEQSLHHQVVAYLDLFRFGVHSSASSRALKESLTRKNRLLQQQEFLKSFCASGGAALVPAPGLAPTSIQQDPQVLSMQVVLEHWRRMAKDFPGFELELLSCNVVTSRCSVASDDKHRFKPIGSDPIVQLTAKTHLRLTRLILKRWFPHLLIAKNKRLLQLVINKSLVMATVLLVFFTNNHKLQREVMEVDVFGAVYQLVQSVDAALAIMQGALMPKSFLVGHEPIAIEFDRSTSRHSQANTPDSGAQEENALVDLAKRHHLNFILCDSGE